VNEEVRSVLKDYPNLKLTHGRKVRRASYSYHIISDTDYWNIIIEFPSRAEYH
jgi:hypothetical protein